MMIIDSDDKLRNACQTGLIVRAIESGKTIFALISADVVFDSEYLLSKCAISEISELKSPLAGGHDKHDHGSPTAALPSALPAACPPLADGTLQRLPETVKPSCGSCNYFLTKLCGRCTDRNLYQKA